MSFFVVILISISLAMDSFAISMANGATLKKLEFSRILLIAFSFGFFQTIMTILGWYLGSSINSFIMSLDIWIAFFLLIFVGGKMVYDSLKEKEHSKINGLSIPTIIMLSIATSLDALAVGLSFSFIKIEIFIASIIIGFVTFILSILGVFLGKEIGDLLGNKVGLFGGLLLIAISILIIL